MDLGLFNILIRIVESKECFVIAFALEAGLCIYYRKNPDDDIVLGAIVTLAVVLFFSIVFFCKDRYRRKELQKKEREENAKIECENKGAAQDVYNVMSEKDKNILFYGIVSGMKSSEDSCKFLFRSIDKYNIQLQRIGEICSKNLFDSLAFYETNGNSFSITIDPYLLEIAEKDIKEYHITKLKLEKYFNILSSNI